MKPELKVGIFVILSIAMFIFAILLLGDVRVARQSTLNIIFTDVSGLPPKAPIKICGVDVGNIKKIELFEGRARVVAKIRRDIKIYKDARASITSTGVIGSKYLDLTLGTKAQPLLNDNDTIVGVSPYNMDILIDKVMSSVDKLMKVVSSLVGDDKEKGSFGKMIDNLSGITHKLNKALGDDETTLKNIVTNIDHFTESVRSVSFQLDEILSNNKSAIEQGIAGFSDIVASLKVAAERLDHITDRMYNGKGPIGELVNNDQMAEDMKETIKSVKEASNSIKHLTKRIGKIQIEWDTKVRYNTKDTVSRADFGIRIRPRQGKYYSLSLDNIMPETSASYDNGDQKVNSITALIAKDSAHWTLYGGAIKSSGGVGIAYSPVKNKRVALSVDAYRFRRDINNTTTPWLDVNTSFRLMEWAYMRVGVEDMLLNNGFTTSVNIVLEDEDIGYLFGLVGLSGL